MGTYLATGVIKDIIIRKKDITCDYITIDKIKEQLSAKLNIDCYNYSEDEKGHYWQIKQEMLENDFAEFLDAQFQMCAKQNEQIKESLKKVQETKSVQELFDLCDSKSLENFQLVSPIIDYISVTRSNGWYEDNVLVYFNMMAYLLEGKIIMECYGKSFAYFEHNIRALQKEKYPIVECVKIMITS